MPFSLFNAACGAAAAVAVPLAVLGLTGLTPAPAASGAVAETVAIAPARFAFPRPGEFLSRGRRVAAIVDTVGFDRPLHIMKHLVGAADYRRCVEDGGCRPADAAPAPAGGDLPATGVSQLDARAYAAWYSATTGRTWRLPTAAEWAFAAAERFVGDPTVGADDPANPATGWIRRYREEAARRRQPDPRPKPRGAFGANAHGIYDLGGNVWEWTATCFAKVSLSEDGTRIASATDHCGVAVAEGRHRAYMPNFVRDGRSGACAVGTPPDNFGFRLVLDQAETVVARLWSATRTAFSQPGVAEGENL